MANAAAIHAKVAAAARKHGGPAVLKKIAPGTVDDLSDESTPPAETEYAVYAFWLPYAPLFGLAAGESFAQGTGRIVRGEICYLAPSDLPDGVEPKPGDRLIVGGVERGITSVEGLRLDGTTALYFRCAVSP